MMVRRHAQVVVHFWINFWLGALSDNSQKFTPFAGTGQEAKDLKVVGDDGPPSKASLSRPSAIAIDPDSGDVYIADTGHHRIRKVDIANGKIETYAGSCWDTKDEEDPSKDKVRCDGFAGDGELASKSIINTPFGMTIHNGILYFADTYNHRIRKIDISTGIISTFAGGGSEDGDDSVDALSIKFSFPTDVAMDAEKEVLYVADWMNNAIRGIDIRAMTVTTFIGDRDGAKWRRKLHGPINIDFDHRKRRIYFGERDGNRLWVWPVDHSPDQDGPLPLTGQSRASSMDEVVPKGYAGNNERADMAQMSKPAGIAVAPNGNVYFADQFNHCIRVVTTDADTPMIQTFTGEVSGRILRNPFGLAFHPRTGDLFVTERGDGHFWVRTWDAGFETGPSAPPPPGQSPRQIETGTCTTPEECAAQAQQNEL